MVNCGENGSCCEKKGIEANERKQNIILIGMPGSGKSTIGAQLANILKMNFIDTDEIIRKDIKKDLKDLVNEAGTEAFLDIQEKCIKEFIMKQDVKNTVIATGGSVVYSESLMNCFKENGIVIFLKSDIKELSDRMGRGRRLARNNNQTILEVYNERLPLYNKYSDVVIDCVKKDIDYIVNKIIKKLNS